MEPLTNKEFNDFIEYYHEGFYWDKYNKKHEFHDTVTELSRSGKKKADPLITHKQKMYGLDWIVKDSRKLSKKPPKSVDALFVRFDEENNYLALHLIEFKFLGKNTQTDKLNILWDDISKKVSCKESIDLENNFEDFDEDSHNSDLNISEDIDDENNEIDADDSNSDLDDCDYEECFDEFFVNDFELIKENFKDPIDVSLKLKAYEVVFITLPLLYEEYCEENPGIIKKDINAYLNGIDKYYWAFIGNRSQSKTNTKSKADKFNEYSERLERTIFKKARVKPWQDFEKVLDREIFENFKG